jgi:hypothetical protein
MRVSLRFAGVTIAALAAAALHAEEKPASTAAAGETPISAAKRDFDTIKAARDGTLQQKAEVPRVSGPELQTGADLGPRPWATKKDELLEKQKKRKSEHWLIDAIEKEKQLEKLDPAQRERELSTPAAERDGHDTASGDRAALGSEAGMLDKPESASATSRDKDKDRDAKPTTVVNPLARYMSDWMTPQDFSLLQTNSAGAAGKETTATASAAGSASVLPGASAASTTAGGLSEALAGLATGGGNKPAAASAPKENPFLQGLGPSVSSGPAFTPPTMPPPPAPAPSPIFAPPPEAAPVRSPIPEFAKPADDAKALKPLKRF